jgi:hypothetical protein
MNVDNVYADMTTLLLCSRIHQNLPLKTRTIKIKRTAKLILKHTESPVLVKLCKNIILAVSSGKYQKTLDVINRVEHDYIILRGATKDA